MFRGGFVTSEYVILTLVRVVAKAFDILISRNCRLANINHHNNIANVYSNNVNKIQNKEHKWKRFACQLAAFLCSVVTNRFFLFHAH